LFMVAALGACDDQPCDPGQRYSKGICLAGAAPTDGGAGTEGGQAPALMCEAGGVTWGGRCMTDADCGCGADSCGKIPGQAVGSCTRTGCKQDPSVCPSGWRCMDLAAFDPMLPSVCVQ